jgi:hypothetical protein
MRDLGETLAAAIPDTVLEVHRSGADVPVIVDGDTVRDALVLAMVTPDRTGRLDSIDQLVDGALAAAAAAPAAFPAS